MEPADLRCGFARHHDFRVALLAPGLPGGGLYGGDITGALRGDGLSGGALRDGGGGGFRGGVCPALDRARGRFFVARAISVVAPVRGACLGCRAPDV